MGEFEDVERLLEALLTHGRLGCEYDIESEDSSVAFLAQLRSRASSGVNHPTQGPFWRSAQQMLGTVERMLSDQVSRRRLATSVRNSGERERERALERMVAAVEVVVASGSKSLTHETRELLVTSFVKPARGLVSEEDLDRALVRRGIRCEPAAKIPAPSTGLPDTDMSRLESELQVFGTDNIYSFIGVPLGAPLALSRERTALAKQSWASKRASHLKACAQAIISCAERYFATEEARRSYDFSYVRRRLDEEGLSASVALAGMDGVIDLREFEQLVENGVRLGYPRDRVTAVVEHAASRQGLSIARRG